MKRDWDTIGTRSLPHDDLFATIPSARDSDVLTSHKGADDIKPRRRTQAGRLYDAFVGAGPNGLTSYEAAEIAGLLTPGCCFWHRVTDLAKLGMVVKTGELRMTPTGSEQTVYRVSL